MDNHILVSIIIPVYNVGKFFENCLDSILSQSYNFFEVLLIDDGSTDNSGDIADDYARKDSRFKVIHKNNSGVSSTRNVGIENALGDYICFVDPDDLLKDDYVEYMLSLCLKYKSDISVCAEVFTTFMPNQREDNVVLVNGEEAACQILYGKITVGCYSKMFSKDFLIRNGIRFMNDVFIGEGFNFNVKAFCYSENVVISQHKVYYYRLDNSDSAMTSFNIAKCEMGVRAISLIRENLIIKSQKLFDAVDFADWNTHSNMYEWMVRAGVKSKYPLFYNKCFKASRKYAFEAFKSPTTMRIKFVALIRMINPFIWAKARVFAKKIANYFNK